MLERRFNKVLTRDSVSVAAGARCLRAEVSLGETLLNPPIKVGVQ